MTGPVVVDFTSAITGSSRVLHRTFESEATYVQWLSTVRDLVEIVAVRPLHPAVA